MLSDTIAAVSTALGEGGIAIVRVSGPEAISEVASLFRGAKPLTEVASHTVHYGHIINPADGERMEEVLVTVMKGPRSFTTEDVVEISAHGGVISVRRVMDLLLQQDIRLAEPGNSPSVPFGRADRSFSGGSGHRFDPFQVRPGFLSCPEAGERFFIRAD